MIELKPDDKAPDFKDKELCDIVLTHLSFMKLFSSDDEVSYSLIIAQSKEETEKLMRDVPDSINITGNYLEITFIDDKFVKVVVINRDNVVPGIEKYLDESS